MGRRHRRTGGSFSLADFSFHQKPTMDEGGDSFKTGIHRGLKGFFSPLQLKCLECRALLCAQSVLTNETADCCRLNGRTDMCGPGSDVVSLLRKTRDETARDFISVPPKLPALSAVTESTRDPFHPFTSTTTWTGGDNGLRMGWISTPPTPAPEAAGDPGGGLGPATGYPAPTHSPQASESYILMDFTSL